MGHPAPGTGDDYMGCPNCGSLNLYRDLRDNINSCHDCGFCHFVGLQTVQDAIENLNARNQAEQRGDEDGSTTEKL